MVHQVTLNLPEAVYQCATQAATARCQPLENVLVDALAAYWLEGITVDKGLETNDEKRAFVAPSIEAADWWNAEGDREWETWQP